MSNIFEELRESHEKQRLLMDALTSTKGDSATRQIFYADLKEELQQHAIAEERYFYAPLIQKDKTVELSRHGIAEHHSIDKIIERLDNTEFNSPAWLTIMQSLQHKVLHHLEEEEHRFFQMAGKVFTEDQKLNLAAQYHKEMVS
ncbi:hemerythrin domain-containing protein [Psychromonas sp. 14N.309.X.WAT.B.A12]|uniref:hemerythrin domain-containing protein n=1 Tax=unclassified Psychromonas TaxID=2614957 RepID=UPI0025B055DB|nr:hemerythrin domain-containing protein [Psychromonas sp. 14N.309.X.WAT.B.A12]MDN2664885.1 hemerythrin domain-containing protein [Psychromonas sp. 14N.309.X.WAT.B.A12]